MPQSAKIATCTYCGTRAALVLQPGQHELTCGACGAPLHDMKRLRADDPAVTLPGKAGKKAKKAKKKKHKGAGYGAPEYGAPGKGGRDPWGALAHEVLGEVTRHGRRKAKRSVARSIFKELKDIFD